VSGRRLLDLRFGLWRRHDEEQRREKVSSLHVECDGLRCRIMTKTLFYILSGVDMNITGFCEKKGSILEPCVL